jgi:hypothetical protein
MNSYTHLSLGEMLIAHANDLAIDSEPRCIAIASRTAVRKARATELRLRLGDRKLTRDLTMVHGLG